MYKFKKLVVGICCISIVVNIALAVLVLNQNSKIEALDFDLQKQEETLDTLRVSLHCANIDKQDYKSYLAEYYSIYGADGLDWLTGVKLKVLFPE